MHLNIVE